MQSTSSLIRKLIMALTGQVLVLFVVFHIAGNSTIFFSSLNAYVAGLYAMPVFVWTGRIVLIAAFCLHIYHGTMLKIENHAARPRGYAVSNYLRATSAGRYQIWTGSVIAVFVIYHLLQFTFQVTNPDIAADTHLDAIGRPDVFMMVVRSLRDIGVFAVYAIALAALGLHLFHGMQSSFQTWGLNTDRSLPVLEKSGAAASVIIFLWYMAIPVMIVTGILRNSR